MKRHPFFLLVVILMIFVGGCSAQTPTAIQMENLQTATPMASSYSPTLTAQPPKYATPTYTPTITPTPTFTPTIPLPEIVVFPTPTQGAYAITVKNVQQVVQLNRLGKGTAYGTSWSPGGKFFGVITSLGLYLYDPKTWKQVKLIETSRSYGWSPDGKFLATTTMSGVKPAGIYLYDGETLEPIKLITTGWRFVWSLDGRWLAIVGSPSIYLYDAQTLKLVQSINTHKSVKNLTFSPDGKTLATLADDRVRVWDIVTGNLIRTLEGSYEGVDSLYAFTYDATGKTLMCLASYDDGSRVVFYMWNLNLMDGRIISSQHRYAEYTYALDAAFSPNGSQAALMIYDEIIILDTWSGEILKTISTDVDKFIEGRLRIEYTPDGQKLITTAGVFDVGQGIRLGVHGCPEFQISSDGKILVCGESGEIQLWDIENSQLLTAWPGAYNWAVDASCSPDSQLVASFYGGNVQIHNVTGEKLQQIEFDPDSVYNLAFNPVVKQASSYVLAVGDGKFWEINNGQVVNTFREYDGGPMAISPDGRLLAYTVGDGVVQVKDLRTKQVLRNLTDVATSRSAGAAEPQGIRKLAYSPDGRILAAGSYEINLGLYDCYSNLYYWNVDTGDLLGTIDGDSCGFAFGPTQDKLAWALGNTVYIRDISTGDTVIKLTKEKPGTEEGYLGIAFSSDGHLLAAGTSTGIIDIWDTGTKKLIRTLKGHGTVGVGHHEIPEGDITSMSFSPYGYLLASAGIDCTVRLWDANTGQFLRVFACFGGPVVFTPDGTLLASGATDGTVWLLGIPQAK